MLPKSRSHSFRKSLEVPPDLCRFKQMLTLDVACIYLLVVFVVMIAKYAVARY